MLWKQNPAGCLDAICIVRCLYVFTWLLLLWLFFSGLLRRCSLVSQMSLVNIMMQPGNPYAFTVFHTGCRLVLFFSGF